MMKKTVVFAGVLMAFHAFASAQDPPYYIRGTSWQETLRTSRDMLYQMEQAGKLGTALPDLGASDFTIMAWIRTESETATIVAKVSPRRRRRDRSADSRQSQNKSFGLAGGAPVYEISSVGTFAARLKVNDGRWHHVALVGRDPMKIYVDGAQTESGRIKDRKNIRPDGPTDTFMIGFGARGFGRGGRGDSGSEAVLDELRIYARKLSADEIQTECNTAGTVGDGLAGWWRFEEGAEDSSGNGHDGRVFRAEEAPGRFGKGLELTGRGGVMLPQSRGATLREELWTLLARDFTDESAGREMKWEKQDNIWAADWIAGDFSELAGRYAKATRDISGLPEKAQKLASKVRTAADIRQTRDVYLLSILNKNALAELPTQLKAIRPAIDSLAREYGQIYPQHDQYLERLTAFDEQLTRLATRPADLQVVSKLRQDFQHLQREALLTDNPLMDFDRLLFVKRYTYQSSHYYTDFIDGCDNPGGNLCTFDLNDGTVTDLLPSMSGGIFGRYDVSFDGTRIVFDWKESMEKGFRIFEVGVDGTGLRQLTFAPPDEQARIKLYDNSFTGAWKGVYNHHTDDMHPCYLPDGGICFTSTRCEYGTLCDAPDVLATAVLYRIDGDGSNMTKLTNSAVSEFSPSVMNDGRIIYSRWEYVDKGQIGVKCLWAMRPDGSGSVEIFGNDIALPPVFNHARAIPDTNNMFVTMGTPHYPSSGVGTIIRLDINYPIRTREPMTYITPDLDIRTEAGFHHMIDGRWVQTSSGPIYMDPYPLSDKFFLVSHNPDKEWNDVRAYGLYLLDEFGNHVPIYKDLEFSCWQPMPLRPRPTPPVLPPLLPVRAVEQEPAVVVMSDVYEGLPGVERGTVKYLRVMEQVPRPWDARRWWDQQGEYEGHTSLISMGPVLGLKVMHGIVPVYEDGSAHFTMPPDKNIYFQALDENFMEVQRQRTYINYRPGEKRSCIGCHEYRQLAPANKSVIALRYPPSVPGPQPGETGPRAIDYPTDVQPVLDKHCISCHGGSEPAGNLALTGEMTNMYSRSYENILRRDLVVTTDEGSDFGGTEPVPPRSIGSHASRFITVLLEGHGDVSLSREEMIRLTTWVDANAQYYGSYYGRKNLRYKDHPNFRPTPTFAEAVSTKAPYTPEDG